MVPEYWLEIIANDNRGRSFGLDLQAWAEASAWTAGGISRKGETDLPTASSETGPSSMITK